MSEYGPMERANLVVYQVRQLEHVDVADGDRLVELVSAHAVEEIDLPGVRQAGDLEQVADFRLARAVKDGRGERNAVAEAFGQGQQLFVLEPGEGFADGGVAEDLAEPAAKRLGANLLAEQARQAVGQLLGGPAEVRLENLADVHA